MYTVSFTHGWVDGAKRQTLDHLYTITNGHVSLVFEKKLPTPLATPLYQININCNLATILQGS